MSIIRDISQALSDLSELIENTRSIVKAINDGKEYLARKHPDASKDFAMLLKQMQIAIEGLAEVTAVVENFRFTMGSLSATEASLERFNKHMLKHNTKVTKLRGKIRKLKADCSKIGRLRDKLNDKSSGRGWSRMFSLVGIRAGQKRDQLALTIGSFYADDLRMIGVVENTLTLAEQSLADVDDSLGPPGQQDPFNVPRATEMLAVYSGMYENSRKRLQQLADDMSNAASSLDRN